MSKIVQIQVVSDPLQWPMDQVVNQREYNCIYALDDGGRILFYDPSREGFKWEEITTPYTQGGFDMRRTD